MSLLSQFGELSSFTGAIKPDESQHRVDELEREISTLTNQVLSLSNEN